MTTLHLSDKKDLQSYSHNVIRFFLILGNLISEERVTVQVGRLCDVRYFTLRSAIGLK